MWFLLIYIPAFGFEGCCINKQSVPMVATIMRCVSLASMCVVVSPAHDDAIWTAAWGRSEADGTDTIITGSLDDMVKVWKW